MANLTRYNPRSLAERRSATTPRTFDEMWESLWRDAWNMFDRDTGTGTLAPAMDVVENENSVTIRVDLPGIDPDKVNVEVEGDTLTISGEMGDTIEKEGERYHYRERSFGSFKRSLRLPDYVNAEKADANFKNGVLNLTLPKREESKPRRIQIHGHNKDAK
ncbi:MAG TPA: Hsp20/alpha crystallin family protein [Aggregatilinea sp.]|jgi:HSP20 family protein|uniref:Hsp20/alpha crystallin family protein n=1 Tax=Aggregatilinea sp. TaxID=2806333 RepID=UPI002C907B10|nr:Hsp20/alpha crystallin family protein [Aggregatilinea sp.]HML23322.1 Hsp20/alpha crystallin family protein [Aggregatilinea sp.]